MFATLGGYRTATADGQIDPDAAGRTIARLLLGGLRGGAAMT